MYVGIKWRALAFAMAVVGGASSQASAAIVFSDDFTNPSGGVSIGDVCWRDPDG